MISALLYVNDIRVSFYDHNSQETVIDDVSFEVYPEEIIGLVGESGSGKSVTARAIMGMIKKSGKIDNGSILFQGRELVGLPQKEYQKIRGKEIAMIFQEPMSSLNPVYTVGEQLVETIVTHLKYNRKQAVQYAIEMLDKVGISMPEKRIKQYPNEFSGGMRQRVMIAISLSCNPKILIADEPTTALDVTIQAQILDLMRKLCRDNHMSAIIVTHDMGVVAEMCQRVVVMYSGKIVEESPVKDMFARPLHPYTSALLKAIPKIGERPASLYTIPGSVPTPNQRLCGCRFHPRCEKCYDKCRLEEPDLFVTETGRKVRCWLYENKSPAVNSQ